MKKLLAFLLALSLAGGAFAQDFGDGSENTAAPAAPAPAARAAAPAPAAGSLEFHGGVHTGLRVDTNYNVVNDEYTTAAYLFGDTENTWGGNGIWAGIQATYTHDVGGATVGLNNVEGIFGWGWLNFLNKMIVLYGGRIGGDALWGTTSDRILDYNADNVTGFRLAFNVMDGLSFGFALPVGDILSPGHTFVGSYSEGSYSGQSDIKDFFSNAVIGVGYELGDLLTFHLTFDLVPEYATGSITDQEFAVAVLGSATVTFKPIVVDFDILFRSEQIDGEYNNVNRNSLSSVFNTSAQFDGDNYARGYVPSTGQTVAPIFVNKGVEGGVRVTYSASPITAWGLIQFDKFEDVDFRLGLYLQGEYKVFGPFSAFLRVFSQNLLKFDRNGLAIRVGGNVKLTDTLTFQFFDQINKIGVDSDYGKIGNRVQFNLDWSF